MQPTFRDKADGRQHRQDRAERLPNQVQAMETQSHSARIMEEASPCFTPGTQVYYATRLPMSLMTAFFAVRCVAGKVTPNRGRAYVPSSKSQSHQLSFMINFVQNATLPSYITRLMSFKSENEYLSNLELAASHPGTLCDSLCELTNLHARDRSMLDRLFTLYDHGVE